MQFLNSWPKFREVITSDYQFFIKGNPSLSDDQIIDTLRQGNFPNNIRGNFSFYFRDLNRTILAVDHLPIENLFYTDQFCGHIFLNVKEELRKNNLPITEDLSIVIQTRLFLGLAYGYDTTVKEIKRVPPASYLEVKPDGTKSIKEYRNIYEQPTGEWSLEELSQIFENFIVQNTKKPFALLYSSGTDSNTVLGYFRKLGIDQQAKYISIRGSNELLSEAPHIERLDKHFNLNVHWLDIGLWNPERSSEQTDTGFTSAYHRTYSAYWPDHQILVKYKAIREFNFRSRVIFTGEVGDQIFGTRYGKTLTKYIIQNQNASADSIAQLFLNCELSKHLNAGLNKDWIALWAIPEIKEAYEKAKQTVIETWNRIETDDVVNKIELLNYIVKGSFRVYPYNQLFDCEFVHPFADGYLFDYVWRIPGRYRLAEGGQTRRLTLAMVKDHMVDWPWNLSKTGVAVMDSDLRWTNLKELYNAVQMAHRKHIS